MVKGAKEPSAEGKNHLANGVDANFWRGRRVLLTGHTGFKGAWLAIWLARMGAKVSGVALPPETASSLFEAACVADLLESSYLVDVRDLGSLKSAVASSSPELVLHLAAQALVRRSYESPVETFETNVMGTVNLLESLRGCADARVAVMVTTDKVYANREWVWPYRENDSLGGQDPYSASKAASEMVIHAFAKSFFTERGLRLASARAGNVIGGGDWSEDRLLPDAVRAWARAEPLEIRRPDAVRPWQHVLEPLGGYLVLAQRLFENRAEHSAYNFGPPPHQAASVRQVIEIARRTWGADAQVVWGDGSSGPHEAGMLKLDTARARDTLGVDPVWPLEISVQRSIQWYRRHLSGESARALCHAEIAAFEATE